MDRDLIDRNELIEKLDPEYKKTAKLIKSGETHLNNLAEGYTEVYDLITHAPTIDAKPVMHGHWEEIEVQLTWCEDDIDIMYKCSNCRENSSDKSNYCPYCGTEMNKEK